MKFQLALSVLLSQAMELQIMEAMRLFPFHFSFKARTVFFFACCFAACRHGESVEEVLPSEGVRKFSKCLLAFPYAWPFLDRTTFTVRCCSRSFGLRLCDSIRTRRKLSDIDASACAQRLHVHTHVVVNTLRTLRTHTHCERELSCLATEEGEN